MTTWRYIKENNVLPAYGLAADEILANRAGNFSSLPTLRLYTYQSHCALVGRFQTIESELNLDYCTEHSIPVNRRPTGGGAIIMGEDQLGVALAIPGKSDDSYARVRQQMELFSEGIITGLDNLGIKVEFRRKNDLEVYGRKIAGLGLHRTTTGGLLFHASLLVGLDVPLMLNVLKTPFEKISDKEISTVSARTTTVRREIELGQKLTLDEVRSFVLDGYRKAFGVDIHVAHYSQPELDEIHQLERDKYYHHDWVFQSTPVPDVTGKTLFKMPNGLLDVRVDLAGQMIKAAYIGGDFFTSEYAIADLEQNLRWHSSRAEEVAKTLSTVYSRWSDDLSNLPQSSLLKAIQKVVQKASISAKKVSADPYGCFVNPGGVHA